MKQQFVVTRTVPQTDIPALIYSWVKTHSLSKCYIHNKNCLSLFILLVVCLTTGPKPLPKRALHTVRSRASSFK